MSHIHEREHYDSATKTLTLSIMNDARDPDHKTKAWEVDPQQQIIDLLTKQVAILEKLLARDPPYHSGSKTVVIESPPDSPEPPF